MRSDTVITATVSSVCVYTQEEKHKKGRRNGVKEKSGLLNDADDSDCDIDNNKQEKYKLLN